MPHVGMATQQAAQQQRHDDVKLAVPDLQGHYPLPIH